MFSIDQIEKAHEKVKSGADFPKYILIVDVQSMSCTYYDKIREKILVEEIPN